MLPKARLDKLAVRELPDETLVHDLTSHKTHCLNPTSAFIWKLCDGRTKVARITELVRDGMHIPDAEVVVRLALEQLSRRSLLQEAVAPLSKSARVSRREVLKRLVTAAVALPVIMTINGVVRGQVPTTAPTVNTPRFLSRGAFCLLNSDCKSGVCLGVTTIPPQTFTNTVPGSFPPVPSVITTPPVSVPGKCA